MGSAGDLNVKVSSLNDAHYPQSLGASRSGLFTQGSFSSIGNGAKPTVKRAQLVCVKIAPL